MNRLFIDNCKILLASHSPRRRELLAHLDIDFEILPLIEVNESFPASMKPAEVPAYISRKKAHPYMADLRDREILLTADTVVINRGEVLGKPSDLQDAYVEKYRPLDKAGAYGIQEWIGYIGISSIRGDYYNVMGLPLHSLYNHLVTISNGFRTKGK